MHVLQVAENEMSMYYYCFKYYKISIKKSYIYSFFIKILKLMGWCGGGGVQRNNSLPWWGGGGGHILGMPLAMSLVTARRTECNPHCACFLCFVG